jgi:hypothetical protein
LKRDEKLLTAVAQASAAGTASVACGSALSGTLYPAHAKPLPEDDQT